MQHSSERWQEFYPNGEPVKNGGISPAPNPETSYLFGAGMVEFYKVENGEIYYLFQRRSEFIDGHPGEWDISAGGHINYGETLIEAAAREAKEEIGVDTSPEKMEFKGFYSRATEKNHNFVTIFFYDLTDKDVDFHFDDHEVSKVEWIAEKDLEDFWPRLKAPVRNDDILIAILKQQTKNLQKRLK